MSNTDFKAQKTPTEEILNKTQKTHSEKQKQLICTSSTAIDQNSSPFDNKETRAEKLRAMIAFQTRK